MSVAGFYDVPPEKRQSNRVGREHQSELHCGVIGGDAMIWDRFVLNEIYLYRYPVDMRKGADGLAALVKTEMTLEPCSPVLFVFINRGRDKLKILLWERNGFWVFYKRLVKQRFHWPDWFAEDALTLSAEQCDFLLQGFNLNGMRPHKNIDLSYYL